MIGLIALLLLAPHLARANGHPVSSGTNFNVLDAGDRGCNAKGQCSKGLVTWSVSEPYLNLWLADAPVSYTTSLGEEIAFQVYYKERDTRPPAYNTFQKWYLHAGAYDDSSGGGGGGPPPEPPAPTPHVPPTGWNHNWFSYVRFSGQYFAAGEYSPDITNAMEDFGAWKATLYVAGGGAIDFDGGVGTEPGDVPNNAHITGCGLVPMNIYHPEQLYPATTNGNAFVPFGGPNVPGQMGFRMVHGDGSLDLYGQVTPLYPGTAVGDALLTEHLDPYGNSTRFYYTNASGQYFLTQVVDYDGNASTLIYSNNVVARVDMPYNRHAYFAYDSQTNLIKITDAAGLQSVISYDVATGAPNLLQTPYGSTQFEITDAGILQAGLDVGNAGGTNRISRSLRVTHPDLSQELFLYRYDSRTVGVPPAPPLEPYSPLGMLDDASELDDNYNSVSNHLYAFYSRNSFHWTRKQYAAVSTNVLTLMTTNDYQLAVLTHWLARDASFLSDVPSLIREASPDGVQPGAQTWFDYSGKLQRDWAGNSAQTAVCQLLPDNTTRYTETEVDEVGNPMNVTSTYGDGGSTRTVLAYQYETVYATQTCVTNGDPFSDTDWSYELLDSVTGPEGEMLVSLSPPSDESVTNTVTTNGLAYVYVTTRPQRRALTVTDAENRTASLWFNPRQQVLGAQLFNGVVVTNSYGGDGWLAKTINLSAHATNTLSFTNGLLRAQTNALGLATQYTWDNLERPLTIHFPGDNTDLSYGYNLLDLSSRSDRLGHATSYQHDAFRHLTRVTDPLLHSFNLGYCSCGALESVTNPANAATTYFRDYNGRVTVEQDGDGFQRGYRRNPIGQVTNLYDSAGNSLDVFYNNQGLVTSVNNRTGLLYAVAYDIHDRPLYVTNAYSAVTGYTYDHLNRPLTRALINGPLTGTESYTYSNQGLASHMDAEGRLTTYGFDDAGRLNTVTNGNGEVVAAAFNPLGELLALTDGRNKTTRWAYDVSGRTLAETNANGVLARTNAYDANGQLIKSWTPAKGLTSFSYDNAGNLTSLTSPNRTVTLRYDALNRLTNVTDSAGTVARTYTDFGAFSGALATEDGAWASDTATIHRTASRKVDYLVLQELTAGGSPTTRTWFYGYDSLNRLNALGSSAGSFTFDYANPAGRLLTTHLPGGNIITNLFDPAGQLLGRWLKNSGGTVLDGFGYTDDLTGLRTNLLRGDGTYANYIYDGIGQVTNATAYEPGGALRKNEDFQYGFDAAGNLQTRVNHTLTQSFSVDNANELTSATRSGTLTVAGTINSLAQSVTVNGQGTAIYTDKTFATTSGLTLANGTNALTFAAIGTSNTTTYTENYNLPATVSYAYDSNGNLTSDGARGYEYDDADRLVRITATNVWKSEFGYDALNRRITRKEYTYSPSASSYLLSAEVHYVWLGMQMLQERDANNKVKVTYTGRLAREDATLNATSYYFTDGNKNVSSLVDSGGNIKAKYRYDSFGNLISKSGPLADANLIRFSGEEYHAQSGLYYYGYRYYSPNLQRWMNQDPIGFAGGMNLYGFVGNNPVNVVDSLGLWGLGFGTYNLGFGLPSLQLFGDPGWMDSNGLHSSTPPGERPQAPSPDDNLDADAEFQQARAHDLADGNATWCDAKDKATEMAIDGALNAATMATGGGEGETLYNSLTKAEKAAAAAAKCKAAAKATAPVEKFSNYIFKEGATHGKDAVFKGLGYSAEDSAQLAKLWEEQAAAKYAQGEYTLGKLDQYGQRIDITVDVPGVGAAAGKSSTVTSGWMIRPDGSITLNTPFSGFPK